MGRDYSELPQGLSMREYVAKGNEALKSKDTWRYGYLCICFAAERNYPVAFLYKSGCCISGKGTEKSERRAIKYFVKAIELSVRLDLGAITLFYKNLNKKEYFLRRLLEIQKIVNAPEIDKFTAMCMRQAQEKSLCTDSSDDSESEAKVILYNELDDIIVRCRNS